MVAFLIKTWPKLSETFILEEILGLERLGQPLHLFALQAPSDAISHDAVARVRAPVSYLHEQDSWSQALARHLRALRRAPLAYLHGAARALLRAEPGRRRDFARALRLAEAMRDHGLTHLHVHFIAEPAGVAEIAAALAGTGFSISAHAKDIYLSNPDVLQRKLRRARFTVTCTDYNRRHLAALAPQATVQRMYHGIDLARFHPSRREAQDSLPLLLAVGRLREKKGFATLIDACARLAERGIALRCEIVGYGEEEAALRARIAARGLDGQVSLAGKLARDEVIARYARARVFVLPSQLGADGDRDGIPNVLLEAMAMQLPVVSTTVSGIPELVQDGHNGRLVEPQDAPALADAIARLLEDAATREAFGRRARDAVCAGFDNDRNLLALRELLAQCSAHDGALAPADAVRSPSGVFDVR